jgi:hypothetical protein
MPLHLEMAGASGSLAVISKVHRNLRQIDRRWFGIDRIVSCDVTDEKEEV